MSKPTFIKLLHAVMDSSAWQSMSDGAKCTVLDIWRRYNGRNNGAISFSRREVQACRGCGSAYAVKYLREAQDHGFIVATKQGAFTGERGRRATTWRLTMEECDGQPATNEWMYFCPESTT